MNEFISFYSSNESKSPPGPLPMELNLQLTGLGGIRIGQAFTIPTDLIPIRYRDSQDQSLSRVGWVITNLEHNIDNNRWVTDISTIMCVIEPHQSEFTVSEDLIDKIWNDIQSNKLLMGLYADVKKARDLLLKDKDYYMTYLCF